MTLDAQIRVECAMTTPPKPLGFGVVKNGKVVAVLSLEQLEAAISEYRELAAVFDARRR